MSYFSCSPFFFKGSEFFKLKHPIKDILSLIVIKIFPSLLFCHIGSIKWLDHTLTGVSGDLKFKFKFL